MKREIPKELEAKIKRNMTILLLVVVALGALISIDIFFVSKVHVGPFLAIRTKVYKDGGTKEYYGLGYKVIKYHQIEGRRDTQIGFWSMPYSTKPTSISTLDLALEFRNYPKKTYKKYYNQYMKIEGEIFKIDKSKKEITLQYKDEDGAYTMNVVCPLVKTDIDLDSYEKGVTISVVGNLIHFENKDGKTPMVVTLKNEFIV